MKRILLFAFHFIILQVSAQIPDVVWNQHFGNSAGAGGQSFIRKADGSHVVLGIVHANGGDVSGYHGGSSDIWVAEVNAAGTVIWQRCLGGSGADLASGNGTGGGSLQATTDGGCILTGITQSGDGDVSKNNGGWDAWVVKLNNSGMIEWQRSFGGANDEKDFKISQTIDGGFLLAGTTLSNNTGDVGPSHGLMDAWIVKLDVDGNIAWEKCLGSSDHEMMGNFVQTSDEGFLLAMCTRGNNGDVSGNHMSGTYDYWIVKTDKSGNISWQKCYGGTDEDYVLDVCKTSGGFAIAGYTYSMNGDVTRNNGDTDCWFIGINPTGTLLWEHAYGGVAADIAYGIEPTADGGFIAACTAETFGGDHGDISNSYGDRDGWLLKLSATGGLEWQLCMGGSNNDWCMQAIPLPGNKYEVLGQSNSFDGTVAGNPWPRSVWIAFVNAGASLPIRFLSFTGKRTGEDVYLQWKAEAVGEGKEFIIERSYNGSKFSQIGTIPYVPDQRSYSYTDKKALMASPVCFYRIRGVDQQGKNDLSSIIRISSAGENKIARLLDNPVREILLLEVYAEAESLWSISITDASGRLLRTSRVSVHKGTNIIREQVGELAAGIYYIQINSNGKIPERILSKGFVKKLA